MELLLTIETPKRPKGTDADQGNCKGDSRHPQPDNGRHWQEGGKSLKDDEAQAGANNRAEALALGLFASEHLAAMAVHRILGLDRAHKRKPRREAVAAQHQGLGGCGWVGREPFLHDGAGGKTLGATRSPAALSKGTQALAISSCLALLGRGWAENQVSPTNRPARNFLNLRCALRRDSHNSLLPMGDKPLCRRRAGLAQASSKPSLRKAELLSIGLDVHRQTIALLLVIYNSPAICADKR